MSKGIRVKIIGMDIDTKDPEHNDYFQKRMREIGIITLIEESEHGYHYRVILNKPVGFKESTRKRFWCGDDPRRVLMDIFKVEKGAKEFDLLFTKKWKGWKKK